MKKKRFIIAFIIVFISGAVLGYLGGQMFPCHRSSPRHGGMSMRSMVFNKMRERLELSDEQADKIRPVVDSWMEKVEEHRRRNAPLVKDLFFGMYDQVEPMLNDGQKQKLSGMREHTLKFIFKDRGGKKHENQKNPADAVTLPASVTTKAQDNKQE